MSQTWQAIRQMSAGSAEPPESRGHLGMGRHRGEPLGELGSVGRRDRDPPRRGEHPQHSRTDLGKRDVDAGERQRLGVGDQTREPEPHRGRVVEEPVEHRPDRLEIEQSLVDVEHDDGLVGHRTSFVRS